MIEGKNFLITGSQPWDTQIGSTIKNTAVELSKKNNVIFLNTPIDYKGYYAKEVDPINAYRKKMIKEKLSPVRKLGKTFWVLDCPFMVFPVGQLPTPLFSFLNMWNNKKIAKYLKKVLPDFGFEKYFLITDMDIYRSLYLKELLNPELFIFYKRDHIIDEPYWLKHGYKCEKELVEKSDIVLANSLYFANQLRDWNSNIYDLETGVNLELYDFDSKRKIPEDIKSIKKPIIGYTGALLTSRLDIDLLYFVAQQRPDYSLVLVGPEDPQFEKHDLHKLDNVYFLGRKEVEELPDYISSFDVCINPQVINKLTIGNYPLKIDEYLAMGRPVIATPTETMKHIFAKHSFLPNDREEYLRMLDQAIAESHDPEKIKDRVAFGRSHSWTNSVAKIYNAIEKTLAKRASEKA